MFQSRFFISCTAFLAVSASALAKEHGDLFATPRALSMGHATTAIADDWESVHTNPAGLANLQTWELRLPDLFQGYISPHVRDLIQKFQDLSKQQSGSVGGQTLTSTLSKFDMEGMSVGVQLLGLGYFRPRMAFMINALDANASFRARTPSLLFAKVNARATFDSGLSLAYAHPFLENHLRAGVTVRPFIARLGLDQELTGTQIINLKDVTSLGGAGWGSDLDLGVQGDMSPLKLGDFGVKLMAGATLQNVLATSFSHKLTDRVSASAIPPLERKANVGVGASLEGMGVLKPTLSFELRDLGIQTDSAIEHLAAAFEVVLKPKSWFKGAVRGHFYKGNIGGGIGGKLLFGELELGTYAVNLGKGPGVGVDRRVYLRMAAAF